METAASVLQKLGSEKVWVVHGCGFDEVTITGKTQVAALENGEIRQFEIGPEDFGFSVQPESEIAGGDAAFNARALRNVLSGEKSAYRDMVIMNAACSFVVADKAGDLEEGIKLASSSIDNGDAQKTLEKLVEVSNRGVA